MSTVRASLILFPSACPEQLCAVDMLLTRHPCYTDPSTEPGDPPQVLFVRCCVSRQVLPNDHVSRQVLPNDHAVAIKDKV